MNPADKLVCIPQNVLKLYELGQFAVLKESKYGYPTLNGSMIVVNDVLPVEHKLNVKLSSKNIFNPPYTTRTFTKYNNGQTWGIEYADITKLWGKTITYQFQVDFANTIETTAQVRAAISWYDANKNFISGSYGKYVYNDKGTHIRTVTATVPQEATYAVIATSIFFNSTANPAEGSSITVFNPMIELGAAATAYTPYIEDLSGVGVSRYGANLFKPYNAENTVNGVTAKLTEDGFVETSGEYNGEQTLIYLFPPSGYEYPILPAGNYYKYLNTYNGIYLFNDINIIFQVRYLDGSWGGNVSSVSNTVSFNKSCRITNIVIEAKSSKGANMRFPAMMGFAGLNITEFEPFKEPQTAANADGTVEGLTSISPSMILATENSNTSIELNYYRDVDSYIDNTLIDLALTGGA